MNSLADMQKVCSLFSDLPCPWFICGGWAIELLLNEIDDEQFKFRRDPSVGLPRERMSFTSLSGLPVLAPEIVLLYKSSRPEENEADFQNIVESLSAESRVWLQAALNTLFAKHSWADRL